MRDELDREDGFEAGAPCTGDEAGAGVGAFSSGDAICTAAGDGAECPGERAGLPGERVGLAGERVELPVFVDDESDA